MSFRSSGNLLILHTSFMCVSVCVCVCGTCICTIFWGQDSPIFPSDFQRDPQKMRNHWLALSLSCSSYMGDRWSGQAGTVEMLTPPHLSPRTVPWKQPSQLRWPPRSSPASRSAQGHHNFGLLLGPGNHRFPVERKTEAHWVGRFK